jgi:hypothetical protein
VIATDPGTITRVQGVGFSSPKTRVVTGGIRARLTVARNHSLVDGLGTFYTLYFIYTPLDYLKYTSPTLKNVVFPLLMQFLTWTS